MEYFDKNLLQKSKVYVTNLVARIKSLYWLFSFENLLKI
jgi:hypothetical protein